MPGRDLITTAAMEQQAEPFSSKPRGFALPGQHGEGLLVERH
jgi:hypothetical protein